MELPKRKPSKAKRAKAKRTSTFTGKVDEIMNPGGRASQKKNYGTARNVPALSEVLQGAYQHGKQVYKDSTAKMSNGGKVKMSKYYSGGGKIYTGRD
jgi:hypothetical protein